ncbi:hypothetical protein WJX84_010739 [Apatococcus fuscideae]|uniref:glycerophosphodiester phosphodiesterase n=1 Tax=Apatococcus fuscideae TaxID=2026836 RepID=A0AAW1SZ79_9CHLO
MVYPAYVIIILIAVYVLYSKVLGRVHASHTLTNYQMAHPVPSVQAKRLLRSCPLGTGTLKAFQALWKTGIHCFDMDAVLTKDGHVLVTHPKRIQAALNSTKTAPLEQNVQNLQLDQVRELGAPAALFPEVDELLEAFAESVKDYPGGAGSQQMLIQGAPSRGPLLFLEFKDKAFSAAAVSQVSEAVKRLGLEKNVAMFLVSDAHQERLVAEDISWEGLFIRGYMDAQQSPDGVWVPDTPSIRRDLLQRHSMVGPSIKLPVAFFAELATATDHQPAYVWNVDDASGLQKAINVSAQDFSMHGFSGLSKQLLEAPPLEEDMLRCIDRKHNAGIGGEGIDVTV